MAFDRSGVQKRRCDTSLAEKSAVCISHDTTSPNIWKERRLLIRQCTTDLSVPAPWILAANLVEFDNVKPTHLQKEKTCLFARCHTFFSVVQEFHLERPFGIKIVGCSFRVVAVSVTDRYVQTCLLWECWRREAWQAGPQVRVMLGEIRELILWTNPSCKSTFTGSARLSVLVWSHDSGRSSGREMMRGPHAL